MQLEECHQLPGSWQQLELEHDFFLKLGNLWCAVDVLFNCFTGHAQTRKSQACRPRDPVRFPVPGPRFPVVHTVPAESGNGGLVVGTSKYSNSQDHGYYSGAG